MTTQEIQKLLSIPNSTLHDWENSKKREKLIKLLQGLDYKTASEIIKTYKPTAKYSSSTRKIKLNKKYFKRDLLWSLSDRSDIEINHLITIYLLTPEQDDTAVLLKLFGYERVIKVLKKIKKQIHHDDYQEALEQIEYANDSENFFKKYHLPSLDKILKYPRKRYIEKLLTRYSTQQILDLAKEQHVSFPALFQLKKITGVAA
jgi:hypothetical protein